MVDVHLRFVEPVEEPVDLNRVESSLIAQCIWPRRPWVSNRTLEFVTFRRRERFIGNGELDLFKKRIIKSSIGENERVWAETQVLQSGWAEASRLRHWKRHKQDRLRNDAGDLVDGELRAETTADFFQNNRWGVVPLSLLSRPRPSAKH